MTICHWTAAGASGVSVISEHALITFTRRRGPGSARHVPREVPAALAVAEAARTQRLAGISEYRDDVPELIRGQAARADVAAMSRGQNLTRQPCGCNR